MRELFADGGYQGPVFEQGVARVMTRLDVGIVRRSDAGVGFITLPSHWMVEHGFAWLNRCRRPARDRENKRRNALAFLKLAPMRVMLRKLCKD